jgi:hypothetical protein
MTFSVFQNTSYQHSLVHVEIDRDNGLIKRTFNEQLPCVSRHINPNKWSSQQIKNLFDNEIYWLEKLNGSKFLPELISYDVNEQSVTQKFYEHNCLITKKIPSVNEILEMYTFFKEHSINKSNGALSNMSYNGNQLIAFDFKHAQIRPIYMDKELYSYDKWLVKIDANLPRLLKEIALQ